MPACAIKPADRRKQVKLVGNDLVKHYGKRPYYTVEQVKAANTRQYVPWDVSCWSHAMFNSHRDFDAYHDTLGESCDYAAMKADMLSSVSSGASDSGSWFDFDLSWLEFPDIDWSVFDFFDLT